MMDKNLLFNLDKLVWVRLQDSFESRDYYYIEDHSKKKFLGITIRKEKKSGFRSGWRLYDDIYSKEEILSKNKYFITDDNKVMFKPHLRMLYQNMNEPVIQFYDTYEEAQDVFDTIKFKLTPDVLLCD